MEWIMELPSLIKEIGEGPFKLIVAVILYFGIRELRMLRKDMNGELALLCLTISKLHEAIAINVQNTVSHEKWLARLERRK